MKIEIVIDSLPPSLNDMLTMHWAKRKEMKKKWDMLVYHKWVECGRPMMLKAVVLKYVLEFKMNRRRDQDNYIGGTKFVNDALKRTFFTRDDSEWVRRIEVDIKRGEDRTLITIEEVE